MERNFKGRLPVTAQGIGYNKFVRIAVEFYTARMRDALGLIPVMSRLDNAAGFITRNHRRLVMLEPQRRARLFSLVLAIYTHRIVRKRTYEVCTQILVRMVSERTRVNNNRVAIHM